MRRTIFALTLVRLFWRLGHPWPILPEHMPTWERLLARFTHLGFYVGLLVIPLLGWAAASAYGAPATPIWGIIPWPNLPLPRSEDLGEALITEAREGDRVLIMGARDDTLIDFARSILDGIAARNQRGA